MGSSVNRRDALSEVAASFEDDYKVSVGPDFPELFDGPDILAGKPGRLTAVFIPKQHELRSPERLRTRLILTRLALPEHAQCLLALNDAFGQEELLENLERDFHAVVRIEDRAGLRRVRSKSQELRKIPEATRHMVESRMTFLLGLSAESQTPWSGAPEELLVQGDEAVSADTDAAEQERQIAPRSLWTGSLMTESELPSHTAINVRVVGGVLVAGGNGHRRPVREHILPYLTLARETAFAVDNGVPYLRHPTAGVIVFQGVSHPRIDPLKPIRASAFAGWALLAAPSRPEFDRSVKATAAWLAGSTRGGA